MQRRRSMVPLDHFVNLFPAQLPDRLVIDITRLLKTQAVFYPARTAFCAQRRDDLHVLGFGFLKTGVKLAEIPAILFRLNQAPGDEQADQLKTAFLHLPHPMPDLFWRAAS